MMENTSPNTYIGRKRNCMEIDNYDHQITPLKKVKYNDSSPFLSGRKRGHVSLTPDAEDDEEIFYPSNAKKTRLYGSFNGFNNGFIMEGGENMNMEIGRDVEMGREFETKLSDKDREIEELKKLCIKMKDEQEKVFHENKILKKAVFIQNNKTQALNEEVAMLRNLISSGTSELHRVRQENEILRTYLDVNHHLPFDEKNHDIF